MAGSSTTPQQQFQYYGTPGKDFPRFNSDAPLPKSLTPTDRHRAHVGLQILPAIALPGFLDTIVTWLFRKIGARPMARGKLQEWLPANLSQLQPDKFSDAYFVERRLNGFNPGKLDRVEGQPWQYVVKYDTRRYKVEDGAILPEYSEARFVLKNQQLQVHSIKYSLKDQVVTCFPNEESDWDKAKYYFRSAEYVFQEIQSHLGRTHMNMDQYAMAFYRNVAENPIYNLLLPHFEGLLNINREGVSLIIGQDGFITTASALDDANIQTVLRDEIKQLSYHWSPQVQALPDVIENNYFDRAALAMWELLEKYIAKFFTDNQAEIAAHWDEIAAMSQDLVAHSIFEPPADHPDLALAINDQADLQQLCVYVLYHCTFFHSWVNNKQYEDGGDIEYTVMGIWDENHPSYDAAKVQKRHDNQVRLMWTLANVHYNPATAFAPSPLKDLLWEYRDRIEPGIPLNHIMMSINI
ncbi:hypothetical protein IQ266_11495 [filamentous cyanobacterium LEGE 11480]|uniref:Lipoxygenase domain-containing protein n=1 Tax=Romeriopsis navalis LEGE 11480 TaxID=2777977 RepID=A0A928VPR3_9CYAN|nr:lipoxygenase family protein [Romeriopsis navalis]MBE9030355.1 hypothetical protein [Romeriopsis navalis LEGE 11480]